jgi:hypothetical protein
MIVSDWQPAGRSFFGPPSTALRVNAILANRASRTERTSCTDAALTIRSAVVLAVLPHDANTRRVARHGCMRNVRRDVDISFVIGCFVEVYETAKDDAAVVCESLKLCRVAVVCR